MEWEKQYNRMVECSYVQSEDRKGRRGSKWGLRQKGKNVLLRARVWRELHRPSDVLHTRKWKGETGPKDVHSAIMPSAQQFSSQHLEACEYASEADLH
jgi:hypothetical protein